MEVQDSGERMGSEVTDLSLNTGSTIYQLCDFEQVNH